MNLYFLVEGKTERKIYPAWLQTLLPSYQRVVSASEAENNSYFLISGGGYPNILDVTLPDAVAEINECANYDFLIIVIDADEVGVAGRITEVSQHIDDLELTLHNFQIKVVVQDCCLESWLLGNRKVFSRNPQDAALRDFVRHYDVYKDDPESMDIPDGFRGLRADYHLQYLRQMLKERNISYTKNHPRDTAEDYYLQELMSRTTATPSHLLSFQDFIDFCQSIAENANQKDPLPLSNESSPTT